MNCSVAIIGSETFLLPFLQFGFPTYTPPSTAELCVYLHRIIAEDAGIIFIEDGYGLQIKDIIDKYRSETTPIIVPLGGSAEGTSFARLMLTELMEKAVGINVL